LKLLKKEVAAFFSQFFIVLLRVKSAVKTNERVKKTTKFLHEKPMNGSAGFGFGW